jgi:hypothetical protein
MSRTGNGREEGRAKELILFVIDAYTHRRAEESLETGILFRY